MVDRAQRPGEQQRIDVMRHTSMTRPRCDEVLDAFAEAVRADERERIAQRIEAEALKWCYDAPRVCSHGDCKARRKDARLARDPGEAAGQ